MPEKNNNAPESPESGSVFEMIMSEAGLDKAGRKDGSTDTNSGSGFEELTGELYRMYHPDRSVGSGHSDSSNYRSITITPKRPEFSENIDISENSDIYENLEGSENYENSDKTDNINDTDRSEDTEDQEDEPLKPQISVSVTRQRIDAAAVTAKRGMRTVGRKLKNSETLKPEVIKDMFFGGSHGEPEIHEAEERAALGEYDENESDQLVFGKRKKRDTDPRGDRMLFRIMYMLTPEQVTDGYMLFYNEFVRKRNVRFTLALSMLSLVFLVSILMVPDGMLSYLLLFACAAAVVMRWVNSISARHEAIAAADRVVNNSYKLSFYNSRIMIESSENDEDGEHSYPPVVIRFEDIDLKLLDYESIYVLVFRRSYLYVIPKESLDEREDRLFSEHLKNILGDDFYVFEKRAEFEENFEDNDENTDDAEEDNNGDNK